MLHRLEGKTFLYFQDIWRFSWPTLTICLNFEENQSHQLQLWVLWESLVRELTRLCFIIIYEDEYVRMQKLRLDSSVWFILRSIEVIWVRPSVKKLDLHDCKEFRLFSSNRIIWVHITWWFCGSHFGSLRKGTRDRFVQQT